MGRLLCRHPIRDRLRQSLCGCPGDQAKRTDAHEPAQQRGRAQGKDRGSRARGSIARRAGDTARFNVTTFTGDKQAPLQIIQACWAICLSNICLKVTLYSCKKKKANILSGESNGTYDKELACYCVGEWDSRQVQT